MHFVNIPVWNCTPIHVSKQGSRPWKTVDCMFAAWQMLPLTLILIFFRDDKPTRWLHVASSGSPKYIPMDWDPWAEAGPSGEIVSHSRLGKVWGSPGETWCLGWPSYSLSPPQPTQLKVKSKIKKFYNLIEDMVLLIDVSALWVWTMISRQQRHHDEVRIQLSISSSHASKEMFFRVLYKQRPFLFACQFYCF